MVRTSTFGVGMQSLWWVCGCVVLWYFAVVLGQFHCFKLICRELKIEGQDAALSPSPWEGGDSARRWPLEWCFVALRDEANYEWTSKDEWKQKKQEWKPVSRPLRDVGDTIFARVNHCMTGVYALLDIIQ